ncbi:hypothetical protein NPIL_332601 [Nephila pilipes]|uniref:Uncharacterized protein n=1 Tax=Nephila pilipes TaxID=299642 RepID=A0A8X6USW2_NEPPI|nr:hypothetical protein NPIL_332601 [Nephila pilipes]
MHWKVKPVVVIHGKEIVYYRYSPFREHYKRSRFFRMPLGNDFSYLSDGLKLGGDQVKADFLLAVPRSHFSLREDSMAVAVPPVAAPKASELEALRRDAKSWSIKKKMERRHLWKISNKVIAK